MAEAEWLVVRMAAAQDRRWKNWWKSGWKCGDVIGAGGDVIGARGLGDDNGVACGEERGAAENGWAVGANDGMTKVVNYYWKGDSGPYAWCVMAEVWIMAVLRAADAGVP